MHIEGVSSRSFLCAFPPTACRMRRQLVSCVGWLQGRSYVLPDVWIRPPLGGKGRKVTGSLESHANGFRYQNPKGEQLDIMYRCPPMPSCFPCMQCRLWVVLPCMSTKKNNEMEQHWGCIRMTSMCIGCHCS